VTASQKEIAEQEADENFYIFGFSLFPTKVTKNLNKNVRKDTRTRIVTSGGTSVSWQLSTKLEH
jgi:hypothetical protein